VESLHFLSKYINMSLRATVQQGVKDVIGATLGNFKANEYTNVY